MKSFSIAKKSIGKVFDSRLLKALLPSYVVLSIVSLFFTSQIWPYLQRMQGDPANFNLDTGYWVFTLLGSLVGLLFLIYILTALRDTEEQNSFKPPKLNQITSKGFKIFLVSIVSYFFIVLGFILLIIPGIFLIKRYIYVLNIALEEDLGVLKTMRRSKQLSKKNGWSILISLILVSIPIYAIYLPIMFNFYPMYNPSASFLLFLFYR